MITGKNLVAGNWQTTSSAIQFKTFNPKTVTPLPTAFEEATEAQIDAAVVEAAAVAAHFAGTSFSERAQFLKTIQEEIQAHTAEILEVYMAESALPEGRAKGELLRTLDQIERFIELLKEGSFVQATLHTQGPDLRKMLFPIGPVVVFGASNFPLAFSTAGGDTISALAAGCPVIVKAHPYHAGTSEWVAQAIHRALKKCDLPLGIFSHLGGQSHVVGRQLVCHPLVKAVGFTGSFAGGKALYDLAQQRACPIPVFAEMGSVNPIFILENRLKSDEGLSELLAGSITMGTGQFCTNPGLIVICDPTPKSSWGVALDEKIKTMELGPMVHSNIETSYTHQISKLKTEFKELAIAPSAASGACLGSVEASYFLAHPTLAEEVFGPFSLVVHCKNANEQLAVAESLSGQLTATLLGDKEDQQQLQALLPILQAKAGRLLFEGVPTGVAVTQAMQHGGPYPATTDSRFSSVGVDAIFRWLRPVAYQDCPNEYLPAALQNENPLQLHRHLNGVLTKAMV